jgi:curved DNA-binding protein
MMAERDFYEVLGVSRTADADAIRSAYRALARKLHPDVNKDPEAQAKFTEVQEAYEVLSDPEKRRLYDRVGTAGYAAAASAHGQPGAGRAHYSWSNVGGGSGAMDFDPDDLQSMFETFFGGRAAGGGSPFERAGGFGGGPRARATRRPTKGRDRTAEIRVPFDVAARGGKRSLRLEATGSTREIDVTIPAGIADGARLRVRGEGEPGAAGSGDLVLTVRVEAHPVWKRGRPDGTGSDGSGVAGLDLTLELPVTITEAVFGARVDLPTPGGRGTLTVPPGTGSGARLRLKGRGITAKGQKGDLYAVVRVVVPDADGLSEAELEALRGLGDRIPSPRTGPGWDG